MSCSKPPRPFVRIHPGWDTAPRPTFSYPSFTLPAAFPSQASAENLKKNCSGDGHCEVNGFNKLTFQLCNGDQEQLFQNPPNPPFGKGGWGDLPFLDKDCLLAYSTQG